MNPRRHAIALCLTALAVALAPAMAPAATYDVRACDAAPGGVANNSWTYSETASGFFEHGDGCSVAPGGEYSGLFVREDLDLNGNVPANAGAYWSFSAPASTTVSALNYSRHLRTYLDDGWRAELRADDLVLEDCVVPTTSNECDRGVTGGSPAAFNGLSASVLRVGARCQPISPATTCTDGGTLQRVTTTLYGATVTVSDPTGPAASALGGTLVGGGWLRGTQTVSFSATDATGIDLLELLRGGTVVASDDRPCDYTFAAPCSSPGISTPASWTSVNTATWPDGTQSMAARATDAAVNASTTAATSVKIDNTPPPAPAPAADAAWSSAPNATWTWSLPAETDRAPIDRVDIELCRDSSCTTEQFAPPASGPVTVTRAVGEGTTALRARHRDEAGNLGAWSSAVAVRRDRGVPAAPQLGAPQRLANGAYRIAVSISDPGPAPLSQLVGEACPGAGGVCQPVTSSTLTEVTTGPLADGTWTVRVRAVDAANNTGANAETTFTASAPTPTPGPTPTATPSDSPTPSPTPSGTPTPTPTQPPVVRRRPTLTITRLRVLARRLFIRGRLPTDATGSVRIVVSAGADRRATTVPVIAGRFRARVKRPARTQLVRVRVRYRGDAAYLPRSVHRSARAPAR